MHSDDEDAGFVVLSPEEKKALLEALAEADAGDFIDGEEFLRELREKRGSRSPDIKD